MTHLDGGSHWTQSHLRVQKCESEKHFPAEGFRDHVATDGMCGTLDAELEVQRTIKS